MTSNKSIEWIYEFYIAKLIFSIALLDYPSHILISRFFTFFQSQLTEEEGEMQVKGEQPAW